MHVERALSRLNGMGDEEGRGSEPSAGGAAPVCFDNGTGDGEAMGRGATFQLRHRVRRRVQLNGVTMITDQASVETFVLKYIGRQRFQPMNEPLGEQPRKGAIDLVRHHRDPGRSGATGEAVGADRPIGAGKLRKDDIGNLIGGATRPWLIAGNL